MVKMSEQQDLSPDSSFSSKAFTINPMDIVKYLLYNWYWFVLSVAIFGGVQWYRYSTTQNVYSCSAQVMFKDALQHMAGLDRFSRYNQKFNVSNEILQFQSSAFMSEAVKRLNADINYTVMDYLRVKELYNQSPVQVDFVDAEPNSSLSITVTPQDKNSVMLSDFPVASKNLIAKLNAVVKTPIGRIKVTPTPYYTEQYYKKGIDVKKNSRGHVTSTLLKNLRIYQAETSDASHNSSSSSILNMSLKDNNVERAKDVLNMLITIYNEENIKDKNKVAVNTANFINERLEIISKELSGVEQDLQNYKEANQMVDVGSEAHYSLSDREEYSTASKDLRMQAQMGNYIKDYLSDPSKSTDLIPTNTGLKDGNVESQIQQYNNTKLKRDRLVEGSSEKNPVVQDLDKSLASMRQSIMRSVDNLNVSNNVRLRDVQSRAGEARAKVSAIPRKQRQMLSIERQQNIKQELYLYLLNKREENALAQATTESNARVINPAMGSETPVAPNEKSMITKGILTGLAVPAVILLFFLFFDTRIRDRKDLENVTSVPFIGEIPKDTSKRTAENEHAILVRSQGRDLISEAFRIVRTNMDFMRVKAKDLKVITFSSFGAGSGKTFVSSNLAATFAQAGKKVLLVDLDIRKGTLTRHMVRKGEHGITTYLAGNSTLEDILKKDELCENVDVIPSGSVAPNPAELLLSDELDKLIEQLRPNYDYILIDNVPYGVVADAAITNRIADLTIFIVRAGKLDRRMLPEIENIYQTGKLT